jgi:hypothetical protein
MQPPRVPHPALRLSASDVDASFAAWLAATALVGGAMLFTGHGLRTAAVPHGVFSLELNFGALPAQLASYDEVTLRRFAFQLGVDYLFMPLYAQGLCVGIWRTTLRRGRAATPALVALLWAMWAAGALDAVENAALLTACLGSASATLGWVATGCAAAKFGLIGLGFVGWAWQARPG